LAIVDNKFYFMLMHMKSCEMIDFLRILSLKNFILNYSLSANKKGYRENHIHNYVELTHWKNSNFYILLLFRTLLSEITRYDLVKKTNKDNIIDIYFFALTK